MSDPIMCIWRDGAFYPSGNYHTARCHDRFGEGELVALEVEAERSVRSHRHYFATIAASSSRPLTEKSRGSAAFLRPMISGNVVSVSGRVLVPVATIAPS